MWFPSESTSQSHVQDRIGATFDDIIRHISLTTVIPHDTLVPKPSMTQTKRLDLTVVVSRLIDRGEDELTRLFKSEDRDSDGVLMTQELGVFLRACDVNADPRQVRHVLEHHTQNAGMLFSSSGHRCDSEQSSARRPRRSSQHSVSLSLEMDLGWCARRKASRMTSHR
jgi:hypothetical protein